MPARRRIPTEDYAREDAAMRAVWAASSGLTDERAIIAQTGCTAADALRVALLRRVAGADLLAAWQARVLSFRQLARIAILDAPLDGERQIALGACIPSCARFLSRAGVAVGADGEPPDRDA